MVQKCTGAAGGVQGKIQGAAVGGGDIAADGEGIGIVDTVGEGDYSDLEQTGTGGVWRMTWRRQRW